MSKIFTNEVKTGFLVILCVGILVGLTVMAGNFAVFDETYKIKATFTNVAGVEADAPVRLSGVEVGKVDSITLNYKKTGGMNILIDMTLERKAKLREGALAKVATLGLMGEKYIELTPGEEGSAIIKANSTIPGKDPADMDAIVQEAQAMMKTASVTMDNISKLAVNLNDAVKDNKSGIDEIVDNLKSTTQNFEEFSDDIKRNPWKLLVKGKEKK